MVALQSRAIGVVINDASSDARNEKHNLSCDKRLAEQCEKNDLLQFPLPIFFIRSSHFLIGLSVRHLIVHFLCDVH